MRKCLTSSNVNSTPNQYSTTTEKLVQYLNVLRKMVPLPRSTLKQRTIRNWTTLGAARAPPINLSSSSYKTNSAQYLSPYVQSGVSLSCLTWRCLLIRRVLSWCYDLNGEPQA